MAIRSRLAGRKPLGPSRGRPQAPSAARPRAMDSRREITLLSAAYPYTAFRQKVVSIVTELKYCGIALGGDDQSLSHKLVKNVPFVHLQVCAGPIQQITKDRNFEVRESHLRRHLILFDTVPSAILKHSVRAPLCTRPREDLCLPRLAASRTPKSSGQHAHSSQAATRRSGNQNVKTASGRAPRRGASSPPKRWS